jgi:hypothetical protein
MQGNVEEVRRQVGETVYARDVSILQLRTSDIFSSFHFPIRWQIMPGTKLTLMPVLVLNLY